MHARRRYLMLLQQAPWKLNGGALIRNYWMTLGAAKRFDVDLIIAEAADAPPSDFAAACASVAFFPRPQGLEYKLRRIADALRPSSSYYTAGKVTRALSDHVAKLCRERAYAAIHVGDLDQHEALPNTGCPPVWYDAHNAESALLKRQAEHEKGVMAIAVGIDAMRVRGIEERLVERAIHVSACSEQDVADLDRLSPGAAAKCTVIPNGVDVARYASVRDAAPQRACITLPGSMDWRPTQQALMWFVDSVLPLLPREVDGAQVDVRVAGRMTAAFAESLAKHPRLNVVPNPIDIRAEIARAQVIAVPVLASSGSRLRILEAWAAGRPVVTTPSGAFGLPHEDGRELLSTRTPAEFAAGCVRLIEDRGLWARVRESGLERVASYDWPKIADRVSEMYGRFLGG
jgi:glycosyltransferase involved in cell wall biosynthesis